MKCITIICFRILGCNSEGKSILSYDKGGKVAAAYEQFGKEVAELGEKQHTQNRDVANDALFEIDKNREETALSKIWDRRLTSSQITRSRS